MKKKRCSKCEKLKLEDDFPVRKRGHVVKPDSYCLDCRKEVNRLNQVASRRRRKVVVTSLTP
jgi:hypothetical protein